MIILAKPGPFKEGEVLFKYQLQKTLFYLGKELEKRGYPESLPLDVFLAAENEPVPEHLNSDLERFEGTDLIETRYEEWSGGKSKRIIMKERGTQIAEELWKALPEPYKLAAIHVKEIIYPLDPETVHHRVHREYPEYIGTYIKNDVE